MFVIGIIINSVIFENIRINGFVLPPPERPAMFDNATRMKTIKPPNISKTGFSKKIFSSSFF
jgi:hypothetical protein